MEEAMVVGVSSGSRSSADWGAHGGLGDGGGDFGLIIAKGTGET